MKLLSLIPFMVFANVCMSQPVTNFLKVSGPLSFDSKQYALAWSSHPTDNYYKHEYLVKGDALKSFKSMLLLEVVVGDMKVADVVAAKLNELKQAKQANPMVNFESFNNASTGEYMIDFMLTANNADGSINILERNVYRYKTVTFPNGKKGILLFGASQRSYGKDADTFLKALKGNRQTLIKQVSQFTLPAVSVS